MDAMHLMLDTFHSKPKDTIRLINCWNMLDSCHWLRAPRITSSLHSAQGTRMLANMIPSPSVAHDLSKGSSTKNVRASQSHGPSAPPCLTVAFQGKVSKHTMPGKDTEASKSLSSPRMAATILEGGPA